MDTKDPIEAPAIEPSAWRQATQSVCCGTPLLTYAGWRERGRRIKVGERPRLPFHFCHCQTEAMDG